MGDNVSQDESNALHDAISVIQHFQTENVFIPTRTIYASSGAEDNEIDYTFAEKLIKNIHALETFSREKITIVLNSPGGSVTQGFAIYDAICQSRCNIHILVRGEAFSMASIIVQAADKRIMGPKSSMMIHVGSEYAEGSPKQVQRTVAEFKRQTQIMEQIYMKRILKKNPNFTLKELQEMMSVDFYISAEEAIKLGLADEIG